MIGNQSKKYLTISHLSQKTGISKSSIHHYIKRGLLNKPVKAHATLSYYDQTHLEQLARIKAMRARDRLSLADIKGCLRCEGASSQQANQFQGADPDSPGKAFAPDTHNGQPDIMRETREAIISTAMQLFSTKGYENTTIDAIIKTLKMGKGTFYKYFSNKKELFLECVDSIVKRVAPANNWKGNPFWDKDIKKRWKEGIMHFMDISSIFRNITDVLFVASLSDDPELKQKAHEQYNYLLHHVEWLIKQDIERGDLKPFNEEIAARFILVTAAALAEYLSASSTYTFEQGIDIWLDFILHGICQGHVPAGQDVINGTFSQAGYPAEKKDGIQDSAAKQDMSITCASIDSLQMQQNAEGVKLIFTSDKGQKIQIVLSGNVHIA